MKMKTLALAAVCGLSGAVAASSGSVRALYFDNPDYTELVLNTMQETINHQWWWSQPDEIYNDNLWSARYFALLTSPVSGEVNLSVDHKDGIILYINNEPLIYAPGKVESSEAITSSATLNMTAGVPVAMRLDFQQLGQAAHCRLFWTLPGGDCVIVPASAFSVWNDTEAPSVPGPMQLVLASDSFVDLSWGPATDNQSVGNYKIYRDGTLAGTSDSGLFRDSNLTAATTYNYTVAAVDIAGNEGEATEPFSVSTLPAPAPGEGTGLRGYYFSDPSLGTLVSTRVDETLDFDWQDGAPVSGLPTENFSIRWVGEIETPYAETYTLHFTYDDRCRVWIDDIMVINSWSWVDSHNPNPVMPLTQSTQINLAAQQKVEIRIEFADTAENAQFKMEWESARTQRQIVPAERLFPGKNLTAGQIRGVQRNSVTSPAWIQGERAYSLAISSADTNVIDLGPSAFAISDNDWQGVTLPADGSKREVNLNWNRTLGNGNVVQMQRKLNLRWKPTDLSGEIWSNYTFATDINSGDDDIIGIVFGYQDPQNHYRFVMNKQAPSYRRVERVLNGNTTILAQDSVAYEMNRDYRVQVRFKAGEFVISVDGQELFEGAIVDDTFVSGSIGFYNLWNVNSRYDNAVVTAADTGIVWVEEDFEGEDTTGWIAVGPGQWGLNNGKLVQTHNTNHTFFILDDPAAWSVGEDASVTIRQGDSLLLTAFGEDQQPIEIAIRKDAGLNPIQTIITTANQFHPYKFEENGTYHIQAKSNGQAFSSGLTVNVVGIEMPQSLACAVEYKRGHGFRAQPGSLRDLVTYHPADPTNLALAKAVYNSWHAWLEFTPLYPETTPVILARINGPTGPVLGTTNVDVFEFGTTAEQYIGVIEEYPDGTMLVEAAMWMKPYIPGLEYRLNIIIGGVTFGDSTLSHNFMSDEMSPNEGPGQFRDPDGTVYKNYQMIMHPDAWRSPCHNINIYQDNQSCATRY